MSTIYMHIDGIDGNVTAKGHEKWIALIDLDFEVKRFTHTEPGRISNREGSRPMLSEIIVTKKMDASSPLLFSESCVGSAKPEVKIHLCQTGQSLSPFAEFTLNNVIISQYQLDTKHHKTSDTREFHYPSEMVGLSYDKIELRYTPHDSKNKPQSPIPAAYDLKQATAA